MNVPEIAKQVGESLRAAPFLVGMLILNLVVLAGFGYMLHEISAAMARRETVLAKCLDRGAGSGEQEEDTIKTFGRASHDRA